MDGSRMEVQRWPTWLDKVNLRHVSNKPNYFGSDDLFVLINHSCGADFVKLGHPITEQNFILFGVDQLLGEVLFSVFCNIIIKDHKGGVTSFE